jgi:hypothetical protein
MVVMSRTVSQVSSLFLGLGYYHTLALCSMELAFGLTLGLPKKRAEFGKRG